MTTATIIKNMPIATVTQKIVNPLLAKNIAFAIVSALGFTIFASSSVAEGYTITVLMNLVWYKTVSPGNRCK